MSNSLDPEQDRAVGPYLGQTCLQRFSAEDTRRQELMSSVSYSEARETLDIKINPCAYIVSMLNPDIYCFKYSIDPDRFFTLLVDTCY